MSHALELYLDLLADRVRMRAYAAAIAAAVGPGDVVVEIGSGLGAFSVLAARAGAKAVIAVEDAPVGRHLLALAQGNGVGDRVRLLEGRSTELTPPVRAELCIFDDFSVLGLRGRTSGTIADARRRWLRRGGRFLPEVLELWAAPVSLPGHEARARPAPFPRGRAPVDLAPLWALGARTPFTVRAEARQLLAPPHRIGRWKVAALPEAELALRYGTTARRAGVVTGLLVWLRLGFGRRLLLDAGPVGPPTAYQQVLLPIPQRLRLRRGDRLRIAIRRDAPRALQGSHELWRWEVATPAGSSGASTFETTPLDLGALLRGRSGS